MASGTLFASVGDVHGHMHALVRLLARWEREHEAALRFVLQVGDFEPHRSEADLATMAAPARYRQLGDFPDFHRGKADFPWPVYFIGGNHEPYGFLDELPDGGPVAANCFYLGRAGAVELSGLKVAGLSGIYRDDCFTAPRPPISEIARQSNKAYIYFTEAEVAQVLDYGAADILLLHDWPAGLLTDAAETPHSLRHDPTGNEYARLVVEALQPQLVFCGHLHHRRRRRVVWPSGKQTDLYGLASIAQGEAAVAVFEAGEDGALREVAG